MDSNLVREIVGAEGALTGAEAARYAVNGAAPTVVGLPETRQQAAALIGRARHQGWALVPYGGGTQIDMGFPPARLDLVLSTERLDRVVDYQPDDMTLTVEAGVTLARIAELLAERGQFLPLNPPFPEKVTAGGMMASAASGSWRAGYGTPRDWIIGCRVVGADGLEVRGGGQVVKNVAGYDLPKLYTGSFGTLGLITEITFKVLPRPAVWRVFRLVFRSAAEAEAMVARMLDSDLQPAALELYFARDPVSKAPASSLPWELEVQFAHEEEAVAWQVRRLAELVGQPDGFRESVPGQDGGMARPERSVLEECSLVARLSGISSQVAELAETAVAQCLSHRKPVTISAQTASGLVSVGTSGDASAELALGLRALAESAGGHCVFPRLPEALTGEIDPWGEIGPELALMRAIKQKVDPTGVFSPGRFVDRI